MPGPRHQPIASTTLLIAGLLTLLTCAAYWPIGSLRFTNYDDPYYVTENFQVRTGLSVQGLLWAFRDSHLANWHPLTWLSHMLDCQLFGLQPAGHHLTSLGFHLANSLLLFLWLSSLTGKSWRCAFVAALFALHPMHVESVAWVAERKDVLSAFFGILTLWAYCQYATCGAQPASRVSNLRSGDGVRPTSQTRIRAIYYVLSLSFFILGLMSKPMLVTWPFVMLLLDYWPLGRLGSPDSSSKAISSGGFVRFRELVSLVREKIPFFALSAGSCLVAVLTQRGASALASLEEVSLAARLVNAVVSYCRYLEKLVWPTDLAAIYPYSHHWPLTRIATALVLLGAVTFFVCWKLRRGYLLVGWAWFLGTLVPVIGLVQIGNQSMADRYSYLPSIGFFLMLVWTIADWVDTQPSARSVAVFGGALVLAGLSLLTFKQVQYWKDSETLFRHALSVTDNNFVAHNSLGFHFADLKQNDQAKSCFQSALAINPECAFSWSGLGRVLAEQGHYEEAITNCQRALQLAPNLAEPHGTMGYALVQLGKVAEGIQEYTIALRLRPDFAPAHYDLANALARQGQIEEAQRHYREAIRLGMRSADAHNNLAYLLVRERKLDEAIAEFQAALALQPDMWQARYGFGDVLSRQGRNAEAAAQFSEALRARPDFVEAFNRLGWLYATCPDPQVRDGAKAVANATQACQLTQYGHPGLLRTLAAAQAEAGQFAEAIATAVQGRKLATAKGQNDLANRFEELLSLFRAGKAFHENSIKEGK